ncbi:MULTISPECIES: ArsR/SmtB family transcription factor [Cysteiniphilum]|uniref:ArsR/SmtB family transcription factor n=1 Tax=Cysteiniphilum TaxID=2056696 RepID=UPI00177C6664|nr:MULTISPECIES: helix-turn-helix domain-containing protein [Cysteiniphilum]
MNNKITHEEAAEIFAELGHSIRLQIIKCSVKYGKEGILVGKIQENLNIPASTLSHHIKRLIKVGLIKQNRSRQMLYCVINQDKLRLLAKHIQLDYLS